MKAKTHFLRVLRIVLAGVMLVGLTWLFVDTTGLAAQYVGWMAKVQFLPAVLRLFVAASLVTLIVVALTLLLTWLFGRIYCSVICPLGIMQDVFTWIGGQKWLKKIWRHLGHNRWHYEQGHRKLRVGIFTAFVILLLLWHPIASLIEPYSLFGRIVHSLTFSGNEAGFLLISSLLLFVGIGVWAFVDGREWCNTICPVGTILSAVSKHSLFRINIDTAKCTGCRACERKCKAKCIDAQNHTVDTSRCVDCFDCLDKCQTGALTYGKPQSPSHKQTAPTDTSRRTFLGMLGVMAATGVAEAKPKTDGGLAIIENKQVPSRQVPLKPAGSQSIRRFSQLCTSCQLCVTACPEHVLRPGTDLQTLLQPEMQFDKGYCLTGCTRCADICPTGAILPITKEEKTSYQIGHAVWIRQNCVVETDGVSCGNCARHCPTGAILMVQNEQGRLIPTVDTEKCIGCGHCEYVCPSRPFSAIYVEGHEQHRRI